MNHLMRARLATLIGCTALSVWLAVICITALIGGTR
jgi:hypothetical protein